MRYIRIKRFADILFSIAGFILLSPVFILLIFLIKVESKGPVLFKQKRVGIHKNYFHILKFRTMKIETPKDMPTHLLSDPDRYITRIGKFLRRSSLDELPQLWNILAGEMSFIGPRPALWNQYDLIAERDQYCANDVLPGLSGWAQINGRDEIPIEVKAMLDGEYVANLGLWMDVRCFFGTIVSVLSSQGVAEGGNTRMEQDMKQETAAEVASSKENEAHG